MICYNKLALRLFFEFGLVKEEKLKEVLLNSALCCFLKQNNSYTYTVIWISQFTTEKFLVLLQRIEQKDIIFLPRLLLFSFFSSLLIKEGRRKGEWITKVVVNKQCLSARSLRNFDNISPLLISEALLIYVPLAILHPIEFKGGSVSKKSKFALYP